MLLFLSFQEIVKFCGIVRNIIIYIGELPWRSGNRNHLHLLCYLPFLSIQFEADTKRHSRELRLRNVGKESISAHFQETKKSTKKEVNFWQSNFVLYQRVPTWRQWLGWVVLLFLEISMNSYQKDLIGQD